MKVFQILNDLCHWETPYQVLTETVGRYAPDILFVAAPDHVFEGWGYLDGEFVKPTPPPGWLYDDATGTMYLEGGVPPTPPAPAVPDPGMQEDTDALLVDHEYRLTLLELGVTPDAV